MKPTFTLGAFGIITDEEDRVLLCLRNDYELWNLPGGGVEHGEAPWECVVREIHEETGLITEVDRLIGIYAKPERDEVVFSYKCSIISGVMTLNEEAREIKYFGRHELPHNTSPKQVERIQHYYQQNDSDQQNDSVIMVKQYGKSTVQLLQEGKL